VQQPKSTAYPYAAVRVEFRPRDRLHSREELLQVLDALAAAGVDAWWYSAEAGGSRPLFPSKALPFVPGEDPDLLPWLVGEAHARGITIMSWAYLNAAPLVLEQHPDWRVRYLDGGASLSDHERRYICLNSPYGDLLKAYAVELVADIGFDGIWFDGCYQASNRQREDGSLPWSCCCRFCAERLRRETGLAMPLTSDWADPAFRRYVLWRSRWWIEYWKSLVEHVRSRKPEAVIAFNFHHRFHWGIASGIGLRRQPMPAVIGSEVDRRPQKLFLEMKYMRAVSDTWPPEMWTHTHDAVWPFVLGPHPEPEPAGLIYHGLACMTAGGFPSYGTDSPLTKTAMMEALVKALGPRARYVGGEPVRHVSLAVSERTLAFARADLARTTWGTERSSSALEVWQSLHGMQYILNSLHLASDAVLDNQLEDDAELQRYGIIILSDTQCLSEAAAEALERFVRAGGVLVATGETGLRDEWGFALDRGRLDGLLGVESRRVRPGVCILEPGPALAGGDLPREFLVSGPARLVRASEAEELARGRVQVFRTRPEDSDDVAEPHPEAVGAILERRVGKGWAVLVAPDVGRIYAQMPNRRTREVMGRVLARHAPPPYEVEAPPNVVVTAWRQEGRIVLHLFNQHPALMQMLGDDDLHLYWPEDVPPTGPVRVRFPGRFAEAACPTGADLEVRKSADAVEVTLPQLAQHEIIVLEP